VLASLLKFLPSTLQKNALHAVLCAESVMLQSSAKSTVQTESIAQTTALQPQGLSPQNIPAEAGYSCMKPSWLLACSGIEKLLMQAQNKSSTVQNLCVTLSSDFVRYAVLPAQTMLTNATEKKAYAQTALRDIYGAVADDWAISLDDVPLHQHTLVAAIDRNLLEKLQQIVIAHQLNLQHVYPYMTVVSRHLHRQVGTTTGFMVIVEPRHLLILGLQKGAYQSVRTIPNGDDWQTTLQQYLVREAILQAGTAALVPSVLVYAPAHKTVSLKNIAHHNVQRISLSGVKLNVNNDNSLAMLEAIA
jgi:hypothetical protein